MKVIINNQKISLSDSDILGEGGEAVVYKKDKYALKIYHDSILNKQRIHKLKKFPQNLPQNVAGPKFAVKNKNNGIIGFGMDLITGATEFNKLALKKYREGNISNKQVTNIFGDLHSTMNILHNRGIIIGDMNDLNLMFKGDKSYFIDVDSMQFDNFPCIVGTQDFIDPKLYGKILDDGGVYFDKKTDYYSYSFLLFKSLLYVSPYGGIHKDYKNFLRRAEASISVYHKDVKYPKNALHYNILPDELNNKFFRIFEKTERFNLETKDLDLSWKKCSKCGLEHARHTCPVCTNLDSNPTKQTTVVLDDVIVTSLFKTSGLITNSFFDRKLFYSYIENNQIRRENNNSVASRLKNTNHVITKDFTLIETNNLVSVIKDQKIVSEFNAEALASNSYTFFYANNNYMYNSANKIVGQIYSSNAWFDIGEKYGFGYYKVGRKTIFFVIDIEKNTIDDSFDLPNIEGKILDKEVYFYEDKILFLVNTRIKGRNYLISYFFKSSGELISYSKDLEYDSVFASINGKIINGRKILSTSNEGLKLIGASNGIFEIEKVFTGTKDVVNTDSQIYSSKEGIYVVDSNQITLVKIK